MNDKKNKDAQEEVEATTDENMEEGQGSALQETETQLLSLKEELEAAQSKAAENLEGWQRAQAEFINYKNRVLRDQDMIRSSMKADLLRRVLPVLDDLERALANRPEQDSWADGLELIARKFQSILEAEGLSRIPAEGQPFDPNFHEAISHEPSNEVESGHVIAVVQNGYMLGEKVIRPAMVRVAQ